MIGDCCGLQRVNYVCGIDWIGTLFLNYHGWFIICLYLPRAVVVKLKGIIHVETHLLLLLMNSSLCMQRTILKENIRENSYLKYCDVNHCGTSISYV